MSTHHPIVGPVATAIAVFPLCAILACASGRSNDSALAPTPGRSAADPSLVSGDGQTMESLFASRFPGVTVSRTNQGGLQIRIRGGTGSFYGSEEPLYILDDTPLPDSHGIATLNPNDIRMIEVLKNPADIGIYGLRGANGVIRITTKKGLR